jgi:hypothetical protein
VATCEEMGGGTVKELTALEKSRRKEFADGTKPSEKLVLRLEMLADGNAVVLERFDKWIATQPDNRETQILKWCRAYRK